MPGHESRMISGRGTDEVARVFSVWGITYLEDDAINDSDKVFTVPSNFEYQILMIRVRLQTSADVGDRLISVRLLTPGGGSIGEVLVGATQAAAQDRQYTLAASLPDLTDFRDTDSLMTPFPPTCILGSGCQIHIYDRNAIAVNADDMTVAILVARQRM